MALDTFTLQNEEFAYFAQRVADEFANRGLKYAFVGNAAVQANILTMMTRKLESPLCSIDEDAQLGEYLRPTTNLDVAIDPSEHDEVHLNRILLEARDSLSHEAISGSEQSIFSYEMGRPGTKNVTFRVSVDGNTSKLFDLRMLRRAQDLPLQTPGFYKELIRESQKVDIPFSENGYRLGFKVASPLYLLALKIVEARPKDCMDVASLVKAMNLFGKGVNSGRLGKILGEDYKYAFDRFISVHGDARTA